MSSLIFILGDQLSESISSLEHYRANSDLILMCEVVSEARYVRHHKKKIALIFSAMRHFSQLLTERGFNVEYIKLDNPDNTGSFTGELKRITAKAKFDRIILTQPSEYRVLEDIRQLEKQIAIPIEVRNDDRFLCSPKEFLSWASERKQLRMEFFYREMRKKFNILVNDDKPVGGKWNYDADNRKSPPTNLNIPSPHIEPIDKITQEIIVLVSNSFSEHFGDLEPFHFAVTRDGALRVLEQFIQQRLPYFGDYQDAMIEGEPWMYHSHISFYLNCGLLLPLECARAAEEAFHTGHAPLNAVEGFVRQIIGWREYVRGIYWFKMPDYLNQNFFAAKRKLPDFYWTAKTKMNCVRQCVLETKQNAYAHHIQRLMILGNFALLAGIAPHEVNEWFLIVYADAYEWVELPNVSGMALFADGGYLASKPYAAGGSYINKMSNYCKKCSYKVTLKTGEQACPFNYLYWDFLQRNRDKLIDNHRIKMMYKTFDRMQPDKQAAIRQDSEDFLKRLDDDTE